MPTHGAETGEDLAELLARVRACQVCAPHLAAGARPIIQFGARARLVIVGQAPGSKVHASGIPWADASGDRLRAWTGIAPEVFDDPERVALVPMGFCYPGKGVSGDLPPRPECAPLWHDVLFSHLATDRLVLLVGGYAQQRYAGPLRKLSLTETVRRGQELGAGLIPLPHPSWRSTLWVRDNPWFETEILPRLRRMVADAVA